MIVLVDMDGVIADFQNGWLKKYKELTGQELPYPECFKMEEAYPEIAPTLVDEIMRAPGFFRDLDPIEGAIDALHMMVNCGIDIFICTTPLRNSIISAHEKFQWIDHWLGEDWINKVICTQDKTLIIGDILIDDKPHIIGLDEQPLWKHILYDKPYNEVGIAGVTNKRPRITWKNWPLIFAYVEFNQTVN